METFFYPIFWFVDSPFLALLPAVVFAVCHVLLRFRSAPFARRVALAACILWLLYGIYEWQMSLWLQNVSNPIRIDLLLIALLLYYVTIWGLAVSFVGFRRPTIAHANSSFSNDRNG